MKNLVIIFLFISNSLLGQDFSKYVNPFIGTSGVGHTYPGATVPFGMVQASPDTHLYDWKYCSGYQYQDTSVLGFSQTHLSGTGCPDLGDILLLPYHGKTFRDTFKTAIDKKREVASAGYYEVYLPNEFVKVKLTATEHVAVHEYTFEKPELSNILLDLQSGIVWDKASLDTHVLESSLKIENFTTISGYVRNTNWVEKKVFFVIKFNKPFLECTYLDPKQKRKLSFNFKTRKNDSVEVKIALSTVSIEGAKKNLVEAAGKTFQSIHQEAKTKWNKYLAKININGSEEDKVNFYTSMYHLFVQPNNIADVDGQYRGADDQIHQGIAKTYYSTLSIWDTYRATHPLYTILCPEKDEEIVQSILSHYETVNMLPIWTLWGKDNFCMIGNHSVPILVDAYKKGILKNTDKEKIYNAIKHSLTVNSWPKYDWSIYNKYGYLPADTIHHESVSCTLEATTDDWCAAEMAKALGYQDDAKFFYNRANFYKNLYDSKYKLFRPRLKSGNWAEPFNPFQFSAGNKYDAFTEGNAWQYFWHVQHDINGLINLVGGKQAFAQKLDSLFTLPAIKENAGADISGMIGQYVHGNEPSHHVAYLYNYANEAYKTQDLIPQILKSQYKNKPDGLCGNDDCGQMSAWYIFSSLGFYPVNPASGIFDIGVPAYTSAVIHLGEKDFKILAPNLSSESKYIQSIYLNGKKINDYKITYNDIMQGGSLVFEMGKTKK